MSTALLCRTRSIGFTATILLVAVLAFLSGGCADRSGEDDQAAIIVFAAASTSDAISAIADEYESRTGVTVRRNFASSSTLARQIQAGAPADVFISADTLWMDAVEADGLIDSASRVDLLGNGLVLIAPADEPFDFNVEGRRSLAEAFVGRLALGDPEHVPAGRYARQALRSLGCWTELEQRVAVAMDVRGALAFVERGEARAGIVYRSDARITDRVIIVAAIPDEHHDAIAYPVALTTDAHTSAADFAGFLTGENARDVLRAAGFDVLP